jgi:NET1-associated nuclear protein 1 (U3 small nucleolar RNA-associated protein 17)
VKLRSVFSYSEGPSSHASHLAPGYAPIAVHSLTSTLILPSSHASSLQIYSPSSSMLVSELEVSPSNRVSRRDEKPLQPARVENVAVSSSGKWMATIDRREEEDGFRGEIYLKFWFWDRSTAHWILNTRIDRPHGSNEVTAMTFSPEMHGNCDLNIVTTGKDGNVKIWRIQRSKNKAGHVEGQSGRQGLLFLNSRCFCRILDPSLDFQLSFRDSDLCIVVARWISSCDINGSLPYSL